MDIEYFSETRFAPDPVDLYKSLNWYGSKGYTIADIEKAADESFYSVYAYDGFIPIGLGRVKSDGQTAAVISGVCVREDYRGRGIGRQIVARLVHYCQSDKYEMDVSLVCEDKLKPWYANLGFSESKSGMLKAYAGERSIVKVMLSAEETEAFAEKLGKGLRGGEIIAFKGDLGAGKTTFTRGLAKGMGLEDFVFSPTFALVNEYSGGELILYHFDMYRVTNMVDLETTGFFDYLSDDCVIAIEWSENIADVLEELSDVITITLENTDKENERKLTISTKGGLKLDFIRD